MEDAELSRERGDYSREIESLDRVIASQPDSTLRNYVVGARSRAVDYLNALKGGRRQ
jgi:hypothetical protein